MNIVQKFFLFSKTKSFRYALVKVKHYVFRHLYLLLHSLLPARFLKYIFCSGEVIIIPGLSAQNPEAISKAKSLLPKDFDVSRVQHSSYVCIYGKDLDFSNEEVVVVAHWDMDAIVDPYVVYMCKSFIGMGKKVILASAQTIAPCQALEIKEKWCHAIVCRTCDGYDFTSWKVTLECFPSLYNCKELILTNDSNFGPMPSFEHVHQRMQLVECDFWGMNYSIGDIPHLQSYYLVFNPIVIQGLAFKQFFTSVAMDNTKGKAVLLESSLTLWLAMHGHTVGTYCKLKEFFEFSLYLQKYSPNMLLELGVPLFKRLNIFSDFGYSQYLACKKNFPHAYPWHLVENYRQRQGISKLKEKINQK